MTIHDTKVSVYLEKAETALKEAQTLLDLGYFDGVRSRATVSSIQAFTGISLANRRQNDPQDIIERVKLFVATDRLPEGADLYFRATILARIDADETGMKTRQEDAMQSISSAQAFLQTVQKQTATLQAETDHEPDMLTIRR